MIGPLPRVYETIDLIFDTTYAKIKDKLCPLLSDFCGFSHLLPTHLKKMLCGIFKKYIMSGNCPSVLSSVVLFV